MGIVLGMQASLCLQVSLTRTYDFRNSKRSYTGVPIMSANMDTTGTLEVALALAEQGLFTCLHKFYSVDEVRQLSCSCTSGYLIFTQWLSGLCIRSKAGLPRQSFSRTLRSQ